MGSQPQSDNQINFSLDDRELSAAPGETILEAATRNGIEIPHLCFKPGYRADGNCRACVVEIEGERALAPSCCRYPTADMQVQSTNARARHSQKIVLELLKSDMPPATENSYTPRARHGSRGASSLSAIKVIQRFRLT